MGSFFLNDFLEPVAPVFADADDVADVTDWDSDTFRCLVLLLASESKMPITEVRLSSSFFVDVAWSV